MMESFMLDKSLSMLSIGAIGLWDNPLDELVCFVHGHKRCEKFFRTLAERRTKRNAFVMPWAVCPIPCETKMKSIIKIMIINHNHLN